MNPRFLHNMGVASLLAGAVFVILAMIWQRLG